MLDMQKRMYVRHWRGSDLAQLPAARHVSDSPAGPELYAQFYEALQARGESPDPEWGQQKVRLGQVISTEVLDRWQRQHRRPPRILSMAVGEGLAERVWLEQGRNVTLHEVQQVSLSALHARFPDAPTVIGDIRHLNAVGEYDIVAMLGLDYVLSRQELRSLFQKMRGWLTEDGYFLVQSVTVLSLRQWAVEIMRGLSGRYRRIPHVFWGWWRSPSEFRRIASAARLRLVSAYHQSYDAHANLILKKRGQTRQLWPLLRSNRLLMIFQVASKGV